MKWVRYSNGNYWVIINTENGTKMRVSYTNDDFYPEFPENIDLKITNWCDVSCPMCHEMSSVWGNHADLLNWKFIDTLTAGTELAIGGGKVTSHPQIIPFLKMLKKKGIIANITIHQAELENNKKLIEKLIKHKLIHGLGVSLVNPTIEVFDFAKKHSNVVFHLIAGISDPNIVHFASDRGKFKFLVLGYKDFGRGHLYNCAHRQLIEQNINKWICALPILFDKVQVMSFDNLAIKQLKIKSMLNTPYYNQVYMGDDSTFTMYIDLVEGKYAGNSTTPKESRLPILDNIADMFSNIKNSCN